MSLLPHLHLPWLAPQPWVCTPMVHMGILGDSKKLRHLLGKVSLFVSKGYIDGNRLPLPPITQRGGGAGNIVSSWRAKFYAVAHLHFSSHLQESL